MHLNERTEKKKEKLLIHNYIFSIYRRNQHNTCRRLNPQTLATKSHKHSNFQVENPLWKDFGEGKENPAGTMMVFHFHGSRQRKIPSPLSPGQPPQPLTDEATLIFAAVGFAATCLAICPCPSHRNELPTVFPFLCEREPFFDERFGKKHGFCSQLQPFDSKRGGFPSSCVVHCTPIAASMPNRRSHCHVSAPRPTCHQIAVGFFCWKI